MSGCGHSPRSRRTPSQGLPKLIVGTSLNAPNREIAEEIRRPIRELVAHGFTPAHPTDDRGYVQLGVDRHQSKLRYLDIKPLRPSADGGYSHASNVPRQPF